MRWHFFENERRRGRAGRGPVVINSNGIGRAVGWSRGLPHGRGPFGNVCMPEPGGLSSWRGRGRGLSLPMPTTPPSTPPRSLGRGYPSSSPPVSPPPLEDCSLPRRCQEAPLRQPWTMLHCLQPHGHFPAPPPMLFMIQMCPNITMTYFPPATIPSACK